MKIYGYADAWSVRQGERLPFRVNSEAGPYRAEIVRLLQVDDRDVGPGYREEEIAAACNGTYPGRTQVLRPGSHLRVRSSPALDIGEGMTITAWIYPSAPERGRQGILSRSGADGAGYALLLEESGEVAFRVSGPAGEAVLASGLAVPKRRWSFVAARWRVGGELRLTQETVDAISPHWPRESAERRITAGAAAPVGGSDLLIGAAGLDGDDAVVGCFNGKIDRPRLFSKALDDAEVLAIRDGGPGPSDHVVAAWDFGATPYGLTVPDAGPHGLQADVVNNPTRAVTDHAWDTTNSYFPAHPDHYSAIYFHDDDLEDAGWDEDFTYEVPNDLPSGVYAARLRAESGDDEDYIPFVVRPRDDAPRAEILYVLPSFTYMAYANERFHSQYFVQWDLASDRPLTLSRQDAFAERHGDFLGPSLYDAHTDGTYCCTSSRLRPVVNLRPKLTAYWNDAGRHFGADMYLVDWLDRRGFQFDVATDEDLDAEGTALLAPYRVILLGSHPEYFSHEMHTAFEEYLSAGGNLMNLGGNGAWWITSRDPVRPHVIEVRKEDPWGIGGMGAAPGERYHQTNAAFGGGWRGAGKGPERLFGSGYASQGFCPAPGYDRQPDSRDPAMAFLFEGVGDDETIGDFGLALGGAAGDEFDCLQPFSPPGTRKLASSSNHHELCLNFSMPYEPIEKQKASVRADISYYETNAGGGVFATGSMCWCTSLPHNGYDNNVARITENALRHFLAAGRGTGSGETE